MIEYYGQLDIPKITIRFGDIVFDHLEDYYQEYNVIHRTKEKSTWYIKLAVLPKGLKEMLWNRNVSEISFEERHRSVETGEDSDRLYSLKEPTIEINEEKDCMDNNPIQYTLIIEGYLK